MIKLSTIRVSLRIKQHLYSVYVNHRLTYIFSLPFKGYSFLFVCCLGFMKSNVESTLFEISGFRPPVFEIFTLLRCYAALPTSTFNFAQQRIPQVENLLHSNNKVALTGI
jgi:hypothetical protein